MSLIKNKKVIIAFAMLVLILTTMVGVVFAWFPSSKKFIDLNFSTAYVDMSYVVYEGVDFNKDGVLDIEVIKNQLGEVTSIKDIYNTTSPIAEFNAFVDVNSPINIENMYPSQVYTCKLILTSYSDINTYLSLSWENPPDILKDVLSVSASLKVGTTYNDLQKLYLGLGNSDKYFVKNVPLSIESPECEIIFKIKFETLDVLTSNAILSSSNLNYYKNRLYKNIEQGEGQSFELFSIKASVSSNII